jgi:hypothetical protein
MDGNHFDDMVREAANRGSRRGVLFALTGGLLAALAPHAGSGKKKKKGKKGGRPKCRERCGGRCVAKCPDIMSRNPVTCQCECPGDMNRCGQICVGGDECCPGEKDCGGGCIREDECCPHDEDCCPHPNKTCPDDSCVPEGACCPGVEVACRSEPDGCCLAGVEECANDGCCPLVGDQKVCDDECVDTSTNRLHCGKCNSWCDAPGFECCNGECKHLENDEENCGACGTVCDHRTEICFDGQCREICSLNQPPWQNACDDGIDHWCCPDRSTVCCRVSGQPHCC